MPTQQEVARILGPEALQRFHSGTAWNPVEWHHSNTRGTIPDVGVWLRKATINGDTETMDLWELEIRLDVPMDPDPKWKTLRSLHMNDIHHYTCDETARSKYADLVTLADELGKHLESMRARPAAEGGPL